MSKTPKHPEPLDGAAGVLAPEPEPPAAKPAYQTQQPVVDVAKPMCTRCGSIRLTTLNSEVMLHSPLDVAGVRWPHSISRRVRCDKCGVRFILRLPYEPKEGPQS